MPQQASLKPVTTFVKGLITEASPLTFPENASVDELNCILKRDGTRGRRKGIEFETGFSLSSFTVPQGTLIHNLTWENVSGEAGVEFLIVQVGATLHFYDKSATPISGGIKSFSINLNLFTAVNGKPVAGTRISGASVNGKFYVASGAIESFVIEYLPDLDEVATTVIVPKVRDFEWQGDVSGYASDVAESVISGDGGRQYDTHNVGWECGTGLCRFFSESGGAWPALTHPWFSGLGDNGSFETSSWRKVYAGNSLLGNGHYILDLYNKDRGSTSGGSVPLLGIETEASRFSSVVAFAGRVWFSGLSSKKNGSRVFFSSVVEGDITNVGNFYQEADPVSQFPDLIDSDGGVINIPSASNIRAMFEWGSSLLVFAENGVWEIKGVDEVFKASAFAVTRLSGADGLLNQAALVDADGTPVWWGPTGIYTVNRGDVSQAAQGQDISKATIQTFWEAIDADQRVNAVGEYDKLNKRVYWLYGSDATVEFKYNKVLLLDLSLQAFYPWSFTDENTSTNYIVGMAYYTGLGAQEMTDDVWANGDDVEANGDDVQVTSSVATVLGDVDIRFMVRDGDTGSLSFGTVTSDTFLDWTTEDYSSYAEAAYDFSGDMTTYKQGIYVVTYFNLTETGFTGNEVDGYDTIGGSSCLMKAFWDLKVGSSSSQEAYRFRRPVIVDSSDLTAFNYPNISVVTRNRIRGRGRVLKLRFESQVGKDFQLQGYEVSGAKNSGL